MNWKKTKRNKIELPIIIKNIQFERKKKMENNKHPIELSFFFAWIHLFSIYTFVDHICQLTGESCKTKQNKTKNSFRRCFCRLGTSFFFWWCCFKQNNKKTDTQCVSVMVLSLSKLVVSNEPKERITRERERERGREIHLEPKAKYPSDNIWNITSRWKFFLFFCQFRIQA